MEACFFLAARNHAMWMFLLLPGFAWCDDSGSRLRSPQGSQCALQQACGREKGWRYGHCKALAWAWTHCFCSHWSWWGVVSQLHVSGHWRSRMSSHFLETTSCFGSWVHFSVGPAISAIGLRDLMFIRRTTREGCKSQKRRMVSYTSKQGQQGFDTKHDKSRPDDMELSYLWPQGDRTLLLVQNA